MILLEKFASLLVLIQLARNNYPILFVNTKSLPRLMSYVKTKKKSG